jgi:trehalose 6-phosphate phosphatase
MTTPLPQPRTAAGRAGLAALLAEPGRALLAFDFDGTLAPIVPDPDAVAAHPAASARLGELGRVIGHLAIVTGRPAHLAVERGEFAGAPGLDGLVVLGHYGLERWEAATGEVTAPPEHPGVALVRRELPAALSAAGVTGAWIEDKGRSLAVHTRRAPEPEVAFAQLQAPLSALAARHGLVVEPGRLVLELRPPGIDKGVALRALVRELSPSVVLFAGDDLGDLAAFDAVDELRGGGIPGVLVCSGSAEVPELAARADLVVPGPEGLIDLLGALAAELSAGN